MNTDRTATKAGSEDFGNMMWPHYTDRGLHASSQESETTQRRKARENFLCLVAFIAIMFLASVL